MQTTINLKILLGSWVWNAIIVIYHCVVVPSINKQAKIHTYIEQNTWNQHDRTVILPPLAVWSHIVLLVLPIDLDSEQVIGQRIDDNENVGKVRLEDCPAIVSPMLAPHNVDLIITQMSNLIKQTDQNRGSLSATTTTSLLVIATLNHISEHVPHY